MFLLLLKNSLNQSESTICSVSSFQNISLGIYSNSSSSQTVNHQVIMNVRVKTELHQSASTNVLNGTDTLSRETTMSK